MLIEIYGAGFANKGAQLMLETTIDKIRSHHPEAKFAINAGADRPPSEVRRLGVSFLWPSGTFHTGKKFWTPTFYKNKLKNTFHYFAKPSKLNDYGLVSRKQVDAFIDISGYSFGDFWGVKPLQHVSSLVDYYKTAGKPVVFLPQMLGPFKQTEVKTLFQGIAQKASLIYAREKSSFEESISISPNAPIKIAPDITIFSPKLDTNRFLPNENRVCIVPNIRVTDSGVSPVSKVEYTDFLVGCARQVVAAGLTPVLVVHETFGADAELAKAVQKELSSQDIEIFTDPDPKALKAFIGGSRFLIGSRFHSLVAALSQKVPVIAFGWAHKYPQLLSDFDVPEFNLKTVGKGSTATSLIETLIDESGYTEVNQRIAAAFERLSVANDQMWKEVFGILGIA